jgi:Asp-tRNA(Asn)/Glu-tRNA(Gln) amidotransferase C subunit
LVKKVKGRVGISDNSSYIKVMKDIKKIIKKLNEVNALLEGNINASNMDVEFMCQRLEDMIQEFEEVGEFEFELEED